MLEVVGYVVLGLILLMVPGFLFSTVLYPKNKSLDFWTRMGISLGLGAMLAAFIGYSISMPEIRALSLGPFVIATVVVCILLGVLTYLRGGFSVLTAYKNGFLKILRKQKKLELQAKPSEQQKITS